MTRDPNLDALRGRADFRRLLADLLDRGARPRPWWWHGRIPKVGQSSSNAEADGPTTGPIALVLVGADIHGGTVFGAADRWAAEEQTHGQFRRREAHQRHPGGSR